MGKPWWPSVPEHEITGQKEHQSRSADVAVRTRRRFNGVDEKNNSGAAQRGRGVKSSDQRSDAATGGRHDTTDSPLHLTKIVRGRYT